MDLPITHRFGKTVTESAGIRAIGRTIPIDAFAIIETGKADYLAIARNFKKWCDGTPMGIGRNTYNVLSFARP